MIEPFIVDKAEKYPYSCAKCGGNMGPFIDVAEVEDNTGAAFRIYLCSRVCARAVARVGGFAPGKKMTELANAAIRIEEIERELEQQKASNDKLRDDLALRLEVNARLDAALNREIGRTRQLERLVGERAKADLQLITGSAEWADINLEHDDAA